MALGFGSEGLGRTFQLRSQLHSPRSRETGTAEFPTDAFSCRLSSVSSALVAMATNIRDRSRPDVLEVHRTEDVLDKFPFRAPFVVRFPRETDLLNSWAGPRTLFLVPFLLSVWTWTAWCVIIPVQSFPFSNLRYCSGLLTAGKLTWHEETVGEVNRVEWKEITSIQIHRTGQDWLNIKSHVTSLQSLGYGVVTTEVKLTASIPYWSNRHCS